MLDANVPLDLANLILTQGIADLYQCDATKLIEALSDFMQKGKGDAIGHKLHTQRISAEEDFLKSLEKAYKNR